MTGSRLARIRPLAVVLLVFVGIGVVVLLQQLEGLWEAAVIAPVVILFVVRVAPVPQVVGAIGIFIGAFVYPLLALVGVAWAWAQLDLERPPPELSFILGAVILGIAVWVYVRPWWLRDPSPHPRRWVAAVVVVLVVLPPVGFALAAALNEDEKGLGGPKFAAVSTLDVVLLQPGDQPQDVTQRNVNGWRVRTWTGGVSSSGVTWGAEGAPPFVPDGEVDTVLVVMPGSGETPGEENVWLDLADEVTSPATPAFALLDTDDQEAIKRWSDAIAGANGRVKRRGEARALADFRNGEVDPGPTDIALRLAALSRDSDELLALAAKHRPALFFDSDDKDNSPLNVDRLIESGKLKLCDTGQALQTLCTEVHESADLHNGATNLAFDPDELAKETEGTTIYVNVRRAGNDHRNAIYLDYWWYLAHNPTGAGGGALCGPGFVIAGVTCFDHQSDWEGVTVVLDDDTRPPAPTAVSYGQHDHVVRYTWDALQETWDRSAGGDRSVRQRYGEGINTRARPLVFVAKGTHASYPRPCFKQHCSGSNGVLGKKFDNPLVENRHNGDTPWSGDYEENCLQICVTALPTRQGGVSAARWNAFEGRWGSSTCILGLPKICTSSNPPRSPGNQDRFESPWCSDFVFTFANGQAGVHRTNGCADFEETADALESGERLLALGDSFSSGQGALDYDPRTTGHGNTCFRSQRAWPQLLAERLNQRALPSLACSNAVMRQVTDNSRRGEAERRVSQVSRISQEPGRRPNTITITIGGNDAGFVNVLGTCIALNCVDFYDRPSGDALERKALAVGRRLPSVYAAIRRAAPGARVVVVGYPRLFPEGKPGGEASNCAAWNQISGAEARYLNNAARLLNAQIAAAAASQGADFVDVTEAFDGHELRCNDPDTYVNRLRFHGQNTTAAFHPNARGHERLAELVANAL